MGQTGHKNRRGQGPWLATLCVPVLIIAALSQPALAAPGSLDTSFDTDGIVITPFNSFYNSSVSSVVTQSNGKIVAAGSTETANGDAFALARYMPNGALDTSFDYNGKVNTLIGYPYSGARAVAIQSNGRIVAAGFAVIGSHTEFALARYMPNGELDTNFHGDGKVTTPFGSGARASSIAIQPNGKIVVAGEALIGGSYDFALARYKVNGNLDSSFSGGKVNTPFGTHDAHAYSVAIQSDGKIVAAGDMFNGTYERFALARYKSHGAPDNTFSGGKVMTSFGPRNASAASVAVQPNGKIVAAGRALNGSNNDLFAIARYKSHGAPDNTFSGGKVTTSINSYSDVTATAVAIQSNGRIVAAGQAFNGTHSEVAITRYKVNGILDGTFGTGGKVTTSINNQDASAKSVTLQSNDGKIVAAGQVYSGNNYEFVLTRYDV